MTITHDQPVHTQQTLAQPKRAPRLPIDGVLLLDKPVGPSSTRVLGHVKHLLKAAKAGHGGTLDPMASGLLPLMFGEATKYAAEGLDADKLYEAEIALGEKTETADAEGVVIERQPVPVLTEDQVRRVLANFMGPQQQLPPMYSALKKDGKALYSYARAGQAVDRTPRPIVIHDIALLGLALPVITIRVLCSKGTYIRTLAEDIGQALGTVAHLKALRRTGVGRLRADEVVSLEALEQAADQDRLHFLKPVDWLIRDWPQVVLGAPQARRFSHGQPVMIQTELAAGLYRVKTENNTFLGTGRVQGGLLSPERLRVLTQH